MTEVPLFLRVSYYNKPCSLEYHRHARNVKIARLIPNTYKDVTIYYPQCNVIHAFLFDIDEIFFYYYFYLKEYKRSFVLILSEYPFICEVGTNRAEQMLHIHI